MSVESAELKEGITILRNLQLLIGKRGSRVHKDSALEVIHRLRAIDGGICGNCTNLELVLMPDKGKGKVRLNCARGYSPTNLYRYTDLGQTPNCPAFKSKKNETFS